MKSARPKVLHNIAGISLIQRVYDRAKHSKRAEAVFDRGPDLSGAVGNKAIGANLQSAGHQAAIAGGLAHFTSLPHVTINGDTAVALFADGGAITLDMTGNAHVTSHAAGGVAILMGGTGSAQVTIASGATVTGETGIFPCSDCQCAPSSKET